eukprot:gene9675-13025_t
MTISCFIQLAWIIVNITFVLPTTNVIIILADDLGYGDLGWGSFTSQEMKNVQSPQLKKMSENGLVLTNFHSAAPVCSPARASIMVGLFPWRIGVDFIYAGDLKLDGSEEMDHEQLPMIPNMAMSFKSQGYYTAHIGKWHLGGMNLNEIKSRGLKNCSIPGINQYGFDEYVAMSEGTGSMRYQTHQERNTYATGSKYLWKNDIPLVARSKAEILTDRQTEEAMRVIREQHAAKQPFFLNLWFDAPHSPWEEIEPYYQKYHSKFNTNILQRYASMISNMDMNIGKLLTLLDELNIAKDTIVVFTSDNGPETSAGSTGLFKGGKRLLTEGGIRVPAIIQWKGKIKKGVASDKFVMSTDLFPTLIEAAGLSMPTHIRIDGVSVLPTLTKNQNSRQLVEKRKETIIKSQFKVNSSITQSATIYGDERVVLWYTHSVGLPKFTAAWSHGFKIIWNDYEGRPGSRLPPTMRMFDMRIDPLENNNLVPHLILNSCENYLSQSPIRWEKVATLQHGSSSLSDSEYVHTALYLLNYLHIRMHLFRHEGEVDWKVYHDNKPYEITPSCHTRSNPHYLQQLPWSNHINAPEFCGVELYEEIYQPHCRCSLHNDCSLAWENVNSVGFLTGLIVRGLTGMSTSRGSLRNYLKDVLDWSRFKPLCAKDHLLDKQIESSRTLLPSHGISKTIRRSCDRHLKIADKNSSISATWSLRVCPERLHLINYDVKSVHISNNHSSVYIGASSCGDDFPVIKLNFKGMQRPIDLCPESFNRLASLATSSNNSKHSSHMSVIDDNGILASLHMQLMLHASNSHILPTDATSSFEIINDCSIIDPLFLNQFDSIDGHSAIIQQHLNKVWNGFFHVHGAGLSHEHGFAGNSNTRFIIIPYYSIISHQWSVCIINLLLLFEQFRQKSWLTGNDNSLLRLTTSRRTGKKYPMSVIYFNGSPNASEATRDEWIKIRNIITNVINKILFNYNNYNNNNNAGVEGSQNINSDISSNLYQPNNIIYFSLANITKSELLSNKQIDDNLDTGNRIDSGAFIIIFVIKIVKKMRKDSELTDAGIKTIINKVDSTSIQTMISNMIQFISKKKSIDMEKRKKYLKYMSSNRYPL